MNKYGGPQVSNANKTPKHIYNLKTRSQIRKHIHKSRKHIRKFKTHSRKSKTHSQMQNTFENTKHSKIQNTFDPGSLLYQRRDRLQSRPSLSTTAMFCSKCGSALEDTLDFCPKCGEKIKKDGSEGKSVHKASPVLSFSSF